MPPPQEKTEYSNSDLCSTRNNTPPYEDITRVDTLIRTTIPFAKLQIVINFDSAFSLDSADHPGRNRPHLPHTISKQDILRYVGNLTMKIFFWFWSQLQKLRDKILHQPVLDQVGVVSSGLKPMLWPPCSLSTLARPFDINSVAATLETRVLFSCSFSLRN
jgi:hypothetical protein